MTYMDQSIGVFAAAPDGDPAPPAPLALAGAGDLRLLLLLVPMILEWRLAFLRRKWHSERGSVCCCSAVPRPPPPPVACRVDR